ncbi:uncharacterized protein FIESC28_04529 [Fusarium coffeatum]|uniref:Uncharacterized protein n=1 Tax=Fusarium coffeatum TaxID=231269 RepID=A0A366S130_9HYPO|nr:uncharacterized protein FIESC28_04529 [Fusarium coffeatum]RBR22335.1 hypothetical protein FIESC28_04529 [Fusarium coffeatum]
MVKQEAENGDEIVRQINAGLGIRQIDFPVQACTKIPTKKLETGTALALREQIVTEIFQQVGFTQRQAPEVWERMGEAIMLRKMLKMTALEQHDRWSTVRGHVGEAVDDLGFIIAALLFRRLQSLDPESREVKHFIEMFGTRNAIQWLSVAVAVSRLVPALRGPFIIEIDEGMRKPEIRSEQILDRRFTVVTTKSPAVNIYEADIREAIRLMDDQSLHSDMRIKTPGLTNHNEELIARSDTTQAELLAPAPAPDRHEVQARQEFFERYKLLWKGSLREHGFISGSLRGLVYQDCTDEQIFYLEETEKDFLAERMG